MNAYPNASILADTGWLAANLQAPGLRVIDCHVNLAPKPGGGFEITSGRETWAKAHIPGADFIDLVKDLSAPDSSFAFTMPSAEQFARVMGAHGIANDSQVVVYSAANGSWATRLFMMFRAMGHANVRVLNGGWEKWQREQRPVSAEAPAHPPATYVPRPRDNVIVGKDAVRARLGDGRTCLVAALPPEAYQGARIPGSRNLAAADLIDPATKTFRPAPELRARLEEIGALGAERVIAYCGGGIAATTDAFALLLLGHDNVAVYDGSMSEWTADASLPLEKP